MSSAFPLTYKEKLTLPPYINKVDQENCSSSELNMQQQYLLKIEVNQVRSEDNVADLFTKSLPKSTFDKGVSHIGLRKVSELPWL